ncbi:unnamed protein product, partial [Rotaria magnacalcarata]
MSIDTNQIPCSKAIPEKSLELHK